MKDERKPDLKFIESFVKRFDRNNPNEKASYDNAIELCKQYPSHESFKDVIVKVIFINGAFKTGIGDTMQVAENITHITGLDKKITEGNMAIVSKLAQYQSPEKKEYNFYSFATKYCHCHNPTQYPIFDSFVKESLEFYRDKWNMKKFYSTHMKNYKEFKDIINLFKEFSNAPTASYALIDRFLWAQSNSEKKIK